jgi:hypothetical protein
VTIAAAVLGLAAVTGGLWQLGARGRDGARDHDALLPARPGPALTLIGVGAVAWVVALALALRS